MSKLVLFGSGLFTLITWLVIISRQVYYRSARAQSREFAPKASQLIMAGSVAECIELASRFPRSHVASVTAAGLSALQNKASNEPASGVVKKAERAMDRAKQLSLAELRGDLAYLEAIAAVSPILALLDSRQAALFFALTTTAPAIGFGILSRSRLSAFEIEINVSVSQILDYIDGALN